MKIKEGVKVKKTKAIARRQPEYMADFRGPGKIREYAAAPISRLDDRDNYPANYTRRDELIWYPSEESRVAKWGGDYNYTEEANLSIKKRVVRKNGKTRVDYEFHGDTDEMFRREVAATLVAALITILVFVAAWTWIIKPIVAAFVSAASM